MKNVIVFLGPSLSIVAAKKIVKADFRGPARQGDVFRALREDPQCIVLIDGLFGGTPSIWHHEIRAAKASGVKVFGAASMGALRAAELPECIVPVGVIAEKFCSGEWNDDADVALLHTDSKDGYRALTVPQVNVWATLNAALAKQVLTQKESKSMILGSGNIFYQERTWNNVLSFAPIKKRSELARFIQREMVDQKAFDAALCLKASARFIKGKSESLVSINNIEFSSFVRRNRIGTVKRKGNSREAMKTLLLAQLALLNGLIADDDVIASKLEMLDLNSLSRDEAFRVAEVLALEEMVISAADRFFPDGPSDLEAKQLASVLKIS